MKSDLYDYKENDVTLSFKFERNDDIKDKKKIFVKLLKKAISDLESEK